MIFVIFPYEKGKMMKRKINLKSIVRDSLALLIIPIGMFFGGCSANLGPLRTSIKMSQDALKSVGKSLKPNEEVSEQYESYSNKFNDEFEKRLRRIENADKIFLLSKMNTPYLYYSMNNLNFLEEDRLNDFMFGINEDAFKDSIKDESFRPFEWSIEIKEDLKDRYENTYKLALSEVAISLPIFQTP